MDDTVRQIRKLVVDTVAKDIAEEDLVGDNLLEELAITSVEALELLIAIENEFDIEIDDEDLDQELVRSVASLHDYVQRRLGSVSA